MAENSAIEWTEATWNPVTGCDRISAGCDHCYALTLAKRLQAMGAAKYQNNGDPRTSGPGFAVTLHPSALTIPSRWRTPRMVFVNSMSDLFHARVPAPFIARVFAVMSLTPHTYQLLTKRHARMRSLLSSPEFRRLVADTAPVYAASPDLAQDYVMTTWPLPNVWLGVSVEDQKWANIRIPALLDTPAAVRWLSCEPLLGPIDLRAAYRRVVGAEGDGPPLADELHWVVAGGESGPGARPMHPRWAEQLRDQCRASGVPFFFKQWGDWSPIAPLDSEGRFDFRRRHALADDGTLYGPGALAWPDGPRVGEALRAGHDRAHLTAMYRVGKKRAGRMLDGRTWDEYPVQVGAVA